MNRVSIRLGLGAVCVVLLIGVIFLFPALLALRLQHEQDQANALMSRQFPVTVNPQNKSIVENERVNAFLESAGSPLSLATGNTQNVVSDLFAWIAVGISDAPWYQSLAAVATVRNRFVAITPGMRKEQVASTFANVLAWNNTQKRAFMTATATSSLPLSEGSFAPGIYSVTKDTTPIMAQALVNERFTREVLSHYGPEIVQIVPLDQALAIASLIEREARGPDDMRIISGIIWNRLFINMHLQIDATLQYAKANTAAAGGWWPKALPADRFRTSPYNTYLHRGLPPTPISNPSVAAILAALNPRDTSCLFYFHDAARQFHCTDTYAAHVALLKKYYGRGK